jgi:hypothetical protein
MVSLTTFFRVHHIGEIACQFVGLCGGYVELVVEFDAEHR